MSSSGLDSIETRVSVLETRMNGMDSVLAGQREAVDRLLDVAYKNSREMVSLKAELGAQNDRVVSLISMHISDEAKERQKATTYALWTLVTLFVTIGVSALAFIVE